MNLRHILPLGGIDELEPLRSLALEAESVGVTTLLIEERPDSELDPVVTLASFTEVAPSIGLGIMLSAHSGRAPSVLAKLLSGLDLVTGGRAHLVIGEMSDLASEDLERIAEQVGLITEMLTHDVTTLEGPNYRVDRAWNTPRMTFAPLVGDKVIVACSPAGFEQMTRVDQATAHSSVIVVDPSSWDRDAPMVERAIERSSPEFVGAMVGIEGDLAAALGLSASIADRFSAVYLRWTVLPSPGDLARCAHAL